MSGSRTGLAVSRAVAIVLLLLFGLAAAAEEIYYYVDENGVMHFANVRVNSKYRLWRRYGPKPRFMSSKDIHYGSLIYAAAKRAGIDPALLVALVEAESNFDRLAVSSKGAKGLCQLTDEVAESYGVKDPFDPAQNLMAGAQHLADLMDRFKSLQLALAAYNAGAGAVVRHKGIPPYDQTENFVEKVTSLYRHYKTLLAPTSSSSLKK